MLNPYYEESADDDLNLGGTAVIFALSIFILRAFFTLLLSKKLERLGKRDGETKFFNG